MMFKLVKTCSAAPEQYDVYDELGTQIGYMRLRHGHFTVHRYGPQGDVVFEALPKGDGIFEADERDYYLKLGLIAILTNAPLEYIVVDEET